MLAGVLIAGAALPWSGAPAASAIVPYLLGSAGLVAVHERLRLAFDRQVALLTTVVVFAGTSLFWSMTRATGLADTLTFALVAGALLAMARLAPVGARRTVGWLMVAALPFVVRVALGDSAGAPLNGWSHVLFSSSIGLLTLTPVAYIALAGTCAAYRAPSVHAVPTLAVVLLWIGGATLLPAAGPEGRFAHGLTAALAVLASGLSFAIDRARQRPWLATAALVVGAVTWNYWLMVQYTIGAIPKDAPVSFRALVAQQADVHTRPPYVYPFAFPANVWFSWREGLPADRFETLAFERRRDRLDLTFDRESSRFLLDGWDAFGAEAAAPHAWIRDRRATLAVPLALPADRPIELFVTVRARLEEPAVNATLGVEINGHEIGRLTAPPAAPLEVGLRVLPDVGPVWRAGYNRVSFVSYGVARVDPTDARPPGPLARRTGDRAWPVAIYRLRIAAASVP